MQARVLSLELRLARVAPRCKFDLIGKMDELRDSFRSLDRTCSIPELKEHFSESSYKCFSFMPFGVMHLDESVGIESLRFSEFDLRDAVQRNDLISALVGIVEASS